jgi:hypothetical protein
MSHLVKFFLVLFVVTMLTACAKTPEGENVKVICPACGTDFNAAFSTKF